jgi:GNAT superfamily N-acetyltransferase
MQGGEHTELRILPAREADAGLLLAFIRKLAVYEKLESQVTADEAKLRESLFGPHPAAGALLAWIGNEPVGFAVYFHNFSTFAGRRGLYIEDLFVEPAYRGRGIGKTLFLHLASLARQRGCARMEWAVLDWNQPAIAFYKKMGAAALDDWTVFRLTGDALQTLPAP